MTRPSRALFTVLTASLALISCDARSVEPKRPVIRRLGTFDVGLVESTPVFVKDRLYRFEYVHKDYKPNTTGDTYFRFIDVESGKATTAFGFGYDLGCAYTEGDSIRVFGVDHWDDTKPKSVGDREFLRGFEFGNLARLHSPNRF